MPDNLPDDLAALKQIPAQMQSKVVHLEEENALLRQRLFGRKSEQTIDPATPQLALFNEAESLAELVAEDVDEKEVARSKRRGKRKPLPADLPRSKSSTNCLSMNWPAFAVAANSPSVRRSANSWRWCRCRSA